MKHWFALLLLVVSVQGEGWAVRFDAHPDNKAIQLVTECKDASGMRTFWAVNVREVDGTDTGRWFPFPRGARRCHHELELVRFGDDPTQSYVAERFTIQ